MYTQLNANFIEQSLFCLRRTVDKHLLAFTEPSVSSPHRDIASLSPWVISASGFRDSLLSCTLAGPYCRWSIPHSAFWDEIWVSVLTSRCVYIRACVSARSYPHLYSCLSVYPPRGLCAFHRPSVLDSQAPRNLTANTTRTAGDEVLCHVWVLFQHEIQKICLAKELLRVYEEAIFVWKNAHLWINKMSEVVVSET